MQNILISWSDFKTFLTDMDAELSYCEKTFSSKPYYLIFSTNSIITVECRIEKKTPTPVGSDQKDFEDNYKSLAITHGATNIVNKICCHEVQPKGDAHNFTATKNTTTSSTYTFSEGTRIRGGQLYAKDWVAGDYVKVEIVDADGVDFDAGTVLKTYIKKMFILTDVMEFVELDSTDELKSGYGIKYTYTSVGQSTDVSVYINQYNYVDA